MDEDREVDALHAAPLASFVEARKAAAARLRKAGDKDAAARVLAMSKPTPAAWAVNALWREHRPAFDDLLGTGETLRAALREAFAGRGRPGEAAELQREQREAVGTLVTRAAELLASSAVPGGTAVLDRVATTLRTISTTGAWGDATPGRLARELGEADLAAIAALLVDEGAARPAREKPTSRPARAASAAAASSHERPARSPAARDGAAGDAAARDPAQGGGPEAAAMGRPAQPSRAELARRARVIAEARATMEAAAADERAARNVAAGALQAAEAAASERAEAQRRAEAARVRAEALHKAAEEATRVAKEALLAVKREADALAQAERAEVAAGRALRSAGIAVEQAGQRLAAARASHEEAERG